LGLAVPIVQVVAARRLFESGIMVKDGSAIERMGEVDTAVLDKTGTLTLGQPRLQKTTIQPRDLAVAARMAEDSRHPLSRAIAQVGASISTTLPVISDVIEHPGLGISANSGGSSYRLGRTEWALDAPDRPRVDGTVLSRD